MNSTSLSAAGLAAGPAAPALPAGGTPRFTPLDPVRVLKQYRLLLMIVTVVAATAGIVATYLLVRYAPQYRAFSRIEVTGQLQKPSEFYSPSAAEERNLETIVTTYVFNVENNDVLTDAMNRLEVQQTKWYQGFVQKGTNALRYDEALVDLQERLEAAALRGTAMFEIRMTCADPTDASVIANVVTRVFLEKEGLRHQLRVTDTQQVFTRDRTRAEADIADLERQMKALIDEGQVSAAQSENNEATILFSALAHQVNLAQQEMQAAKGALDALVKASAEGTFRYTPQEEDTVAQHPFIRSRDERILGLKEERRVIVERFGPEHRTVGEVDLRMEAIRTEMEQKRQELLAIMKDVRLANARQTADAYEARYLDLARRFEEARIKKQELDQKIYEYQLLKERRDRRRDELTSIDKTLADLSLAGRRPDAAPLQLRSAAVTPTTRFFPRYETMVPGVTVMALMVVLGFVFLKEVLDQRVKSPACCRLLPPTDLLGVIPAAKEDPSGPSHLDLVVAEHPAGLLAEAFRQVRTEVLSRMERRGYRTLMLVGSEPRSGVSSVAANLAVSMALNNRRVLLIDANVRKPSQHTLFGLNAESGLGELLSGRADLDRVIQHTQIGGLDVVAAGHAAANTFEQLEGAAFRQLLSHLESRYDLVLIDAPPLSIVGDSALVANSVDAVVLVIRAMQEKRGLVSRMMARMDAMRADFMGLILNGVRSSAGGYFRRNYRAFYAYQNGSLNGHVGAKPSNGRAHVAPHKRAADESADALARADADVDLAKHDDN